MLFSADIAQAFNPIAELVLPTGKPINEAKEEIETRPLTEETNVNNCSMYFKTLQTFLCFLINKYICFVSSKNGFCPNLSFLMQSLK